MDQPNFAGFRRPTSDFRAVRTDFQTGVLMYELDLSTARAIAAATVAELRFAGNSIYIDQATDVGNATIIFQDDSNIRPARMYVGPAFNARVPWTLLLIENVAQPGKTLRIFYGVDIDFQPGLNAQVNIVGTVNVAEQGSLYGASYKSNTPLAANTADPVFLPAANVNGAVIHRAAFQCGDVANPTAAYIAKTSAPTTVIDGDLIVQASAGMFDSVTPRVTTYGQLEQPVRIAAGKGLYFITHVAEDQAHRSVLYTLL